MKTYFCNSCGEKHPAGKICPNPVSWEEPEVREVKETSWMPYIWAVIIGIAIGVLTHDWFFNPDGPAISWESTKVLVSGQNSPDVDSEQCRAWCK